MDVADAEPRCFTICVFQDVDWATRGLEALQGQRFDSGQVSVLAKKADDVESLITSTFDTDPSVFESRGLGTVIALGPLVSALQGIDDGLGKTGVAATIGRAGFQKHDGFIFQTLTERGGVLVAVDSESRAADALALFHSYGGGNAAIGAWAGRV